MAIHGGYTLKRMEEISLKLIKKIITLCLVASLWSLLTISELAIAAESGGGQISSTSKITFYEGEEPVEPKPIAPPKTPIKSGVLPQLGHFIKHYGIWGLATLGLIGLVIFYRRKKQQEEQV